MEKEIKVDGSIFGYNTFVKNDDHIITLKGDRITELDIGMEVILLGDSEGYLPSDFKPGEKVTIVQFTEPFLQPRTDDIVQVSNGSRTGWIKPSNIQVTRYGSEIRCRADANHRRMKSEIRVELATFLDTVYRSMSNTERAELSHEKKCYEDSMVSYALNKLPGFEDLLAQTIANVYESHLFRRFIEDPTRCTDGNRAYLYLDKEGYIVSIINPTIVTTTSDRRFRYIKDYDFYVILSGPFKGQQFAFATPPLAEPVYKSKVDLISQNSVLDKIKNNAGVQQPLAENNLSRITDMENAANTHRPFETSSMILQGKMVLNDFDVFLCYNHSDKSEVKVIGEKLKARGILPWLDEWELRPGLAWQNVLEQHIGKIKSAAVFVGGENIGPWQQQELDALLREFVERSCSIIPVVLPNAPGKPALPIFLKGLTWVDFRIQDPNPFEQLIWGITGERTKGRRF
jgi:hypothetical protein